MKEETKENNSFAAAQEELEFRKCYPCASLCKFMENEVEGGGMMFKNKQKKSTSTKADHKIPGLVSLPNINV